MTQLMISELPGLDCGLCGYRTCVELAEKLITEPQLLNAASIFRKIKYPRNHEQQRRNRALHLHAGHARQEKLPARASRKRRGETVRIGSSTFIRSIFRKSRGRVRLSCRIILC